MSERAGASLADVARTGMMLTGVPKMEAAARVRKEFVGVCKPVGTIVEITRFVDPE